MSVSETDMMDVGAYTRDLGYDRVYDGDDRLDHAVRGYLEGMGYFDTFDGVEAWSGGMDAVTKDIGIYGGQVAIANFLEHQELEPVMVGGWAVATHLALVDGPEAFVEWRGSHDMDIYIEDRRNLAAVDGLGARRSPNPHHSGGGRDKYTTQVSVLGEDVTCDIMQPSEGYDAQFTAEDAETYELDVLDCTVRIPELEHILSDKIRVGRERDRQDVMNLLYAAEERGKDPVELREAVREDRDRDEIGAALDEYALYQGQKPSQEYVQEFGGDAYALQQI